MGYSPWGHKESDTTERLSAHTCMQGRCMEVLYLSKNSGHFILHPQYMHMHMYIHAYTYSGSSSVMDEGVRKPVTGKSLQRGQKQAALSEPIDLEQ